MKNKIKRRGSGDLDSIFLSIFFMILGVLMIIGFCTILSWTLPDFIRDKAKVVEKVEYNTPNKTKYYIYVLEGIEDRRLEVNKPVFDGIKVGDVVNSRIEKVD